MDMTADQQVEALRAEGLDDEMQVSYDMEIVVTLLSGMVIVAMMMIQSRIDFPTDHTKGLCSFHSAYQHT